MKSPWDDENVAREQRALVDRQLQAKPWPKHFQVYVEAIALTQCPGDILEVGCGVGHGREILDRAGLRYRHYDGVDISGPAIRIARERYPESIWGQSSASSGRTRDIVTDGSCLLHVDDPVAHIGELCATSRRWVLLHRVPANPGDTDPARHETLGYGKTFPAWHFSDGWLHTEMARHGFEPVQEWGCPEDASISSLYARPRHWVTYFDSAYWPKARAMYRSLQKHAGPFVLHALCWDERALELASEAGMAAMRVEEFLTKHPDLAAEKLPGLPRSRVEYMWTVGPQWIAEVMKRTGEPVTYIDADVFLHSSPEPVFAEIGRAAAGVIPHGFALAEQRLPGPTVESHSVFGTYNVGIVHFNERHVADRWASECRAWCYDRLAQRDDGAWIYGDQAYLNLWPREFGAHVVQHPGACLGPWAVHARALDVRDGVIHFGGRPLVAYHYSGLRTLPDGHSVATRPEYLLGRRQEEIIYAPYYRALEDPS